MKLSWESGWKFHNWPKWHCTRPQNFKCSTWQKIGQLHICPILCLKKNTQLCIQKKTEWFSKIVSKIIILYIYIYICISKHVKWKFPFFYENSAGSLQLCIFFWEKNSSTNQPPRWKTKTTGTSVTAKLLRCIRISFPSLDQRRKTGCFGGFYNGLPTWAAKVCHMPCCFHAIFGLPAFLLGNFRLFLGKLPYVSS